MPVCKYFIWVLLNGGFVVERQKFPLEDLREEFCIWLSSTLQKWIQDRSGKLL